MKMAPESVVKMNGHQPDVKAKKMPPVTNRPTKSAITKNTSGLTASAKKTSCPMDERLGTSGVRRDRTAIAPVSPLRQSDIAPRAFHPGSSEHRPLPAKSLSWTVAAAMPLSDVATQLLYRAPVS